MQQVYLNNTKENIKNSILLFNELPIKEACIKLMNVLGYDSPKVQDYDLNDYINDFENNQTATIEKAKVLTDWKKASFIFQITTDEVDKHYDLFTDVNKVNNVLIESYFVTAIELNKNNYTRTELAEISRQVNKLHGLPTLIFFKYDNYLTISITYRRLNKKDKTKDVLEKVILIKDINIEKPHRGQIDILSEMSLSSLFENKHKVTNWVELHQAWMQVLDL